MFVVVCVIPSLGQQRGQYTPGQYGLNAGLGIQPDPGFTFANLSLNYSADSLRNSEGNKIPITGTFSIWATENIFMYASTPKILGASFVSMASLNFADGTLAANITPALGLNGGGEGFADTWVQPVNLAWHLKRFDTWVGYAFVAPTGKFSPLALNNVGSGYWGNNFATGTTFYVTKDKGTSLNLATNWEFHGQKRDINITPGQAFTDEFGLGQIIPLKKDLSRLAQVGVVGFDQWQVSANQGLTAAFPYYSVHAIGAQGNIVLPAKDFAVFFKYYDEYLAKATTQGRTIVFGFSWTLRDPKAKPKQ